METDPSKKTYPGARYFREFISRIRKDEDAGKYEHLEDYPYDIHVDEGLGIRLYHAGINPYDPEHFRHQLYLVVTTTGKASKLCRPDTVVASALTLQWTKRGDLCNALLLSIKSYGQCTFAWCGDKSRNKCGWCGHNMKTLLWRKDEWKWMVFRRGRVLKVDQGERHCCRWNPVMKRYQCCKCNDPDNALMSPLDREEAAAMPQSVLPATIEGYNQNINNSHRPHSHRHRRSSNSNRSGGESGALVSASQSTSSLAKSGAEKTPLPSPPATATTTTHNYFFVGHNHIYPTPNGGGPVAPGGPLVPAYSFLSAGLEFTDPPQALIDFPPIPEDVMRRCVSPNSGYRRGRVIEEVDDSGFDSSDSGHRHAHGHGPGPGRGIRRRGTADSGSGYGSGAGGAGPVTKNSAGPSSSSKAVKYARPHVEDDVSEVGGPQEAYGAAEKMSRLEINSKA